MNKINIKRMKEYNPLWHTIEGLDEDNENVAEHLSPILEEIFNITNDISEMEQTIKDEFIKNGDKDSKEIIIRNMNNELVNFENKEFSQINNSDNLNYDFFVDLRDKANALKDMVSQVFNGNMNIEQNNNEASKLKLIKHYERNLKSVKSSFNDNSELSQEYIEYAEEMLEIVKESGQIGLTKFWEERKLLDFLKDNKIQIKDEMAVIISNIFASLKQLMEKMDREELENFKSDNIDTLNLIMDIKRDTKVSDIKEYLGFHDTSVKLDSNYGDKMEEFLDSIYVLATRGNLVIKSEPDYIIKYRSSKDGYQSDIGVNIINCQKKDNSEYALNYFHNSKIFEKFLIGLIENNGIASIKNSKEHLESFEVNDKKAIEILYEKTQLQKIVKKDVSTIKTPTKK